MDISSNLHELFELLTRPQRIVIVSHLNPDGDAIGSMMGLYHYLVQLKQDVQPISPTLVPNYLKWVPNVEKVIDAEEQPEEALKHISQADIIFCLDFGVLSRAKSLELPISQARAGLVNIDHHADFNDFSHYYFRDINASSTCELVYHFINTHSGKKRINSKLANCLFLGIMTDTGSFRYRSANSQTFKVAAELMECGADNEMINHHVNNNHSFNRTQLLGKLLSECLHVLYEYNTAYLLITSQDYEKYQIEDGETEGMVNYTLSLKGINLGIMLVEKSDIIKMSFRSVGKFPANELAKQFSGGGHFNAAGGKSNESIEATVDKLKSLLEVYKPQLLYKPFSE